MSKGRTYSIVIPNRYEDIILPLISSLDKFESDPFHLLVVADKHDRNYGHDQIRVDGDFIFSKSVNAGIKHCEPADIILVNDDIRFLQPNSLETLSQIAYSDPAIGILTPLIDGGCGNIYMRASRLDLWKNNTTGLHYPVGDRGGNRVTFPCVYIKRELLNQIGLFDENFSGYGFDDADMCIRTVKAGWKLAITNKVTVQHGEGGSETFERGKNYSKSFFRNRKPAQANLHYLLKKHNLIKNID